MKRIAFILSCYCYLNIKGVDSYDKPYSSIDLIMKPYRDETLLETLASTAEDVIVVAKNLFEQTIVAIRNINFPEAPLYNDLPQASYNTSQLIGLQLGYPVEEHSATTKDGYILSLQRIPNDKRGYSTPVVLMLHGFLESSQVFVINAHPNQNLQVDWRVGTATMLWDEGFDVWLGNFRGSPYSRNHVKYKVTDPEFFEFSINEQALLDIPAMIDYILSVTGKEKISLCAHSMGTTNSFAFLSKNSSYADKTNILVAMAPVAQATYSTAPMQRLYPIANLFTLLSGMAGTVGEFFPANDAVDRTIDNICRVSILNAFVCQTSYSILFSIRAKNLNQTLYPLILSQFPSSTSTYVLVHFGQLANSRRFQMFNFGDLNPQVYQQEYPPEFPVREIRTPVALYSSETDIIADQRDIDFLRERLPNIVEDLVLDQSLEFGHHDFGFGVNAHVLVYPQIVRKLKEYAQY